MVREHRTALICERYGGKGLSCLHTKEKRKKKGTENLLGSIRSFPFNSVAESLGIPHKGRIASGQRKN